MAYIDRNDIRSFWDKYVLSLPLDRRDQLKYPEVGFAGNREITDGLIQLYLSGKKTAGSSLVRDFISAGDALPEAGNHWILLDSRERPVLLLKTLRTEVHRFGAIPERIAIAEGEGDLSVAYWQKVHGELYRPYLKKCGIADLEQAEVITEFFEIVYRPEAKF